MEEVRKLPVPNVMDDTCQEQFLELSYLNGALEPHLFPGAMALDHLGRAWGSSVHGRAVSHHHRCHCDSRSATPTYCEGAPAPSTWTAGTQKIPSPPPPAPYEEYGYDDPYAEQSYEGYDSYSSQGQGDSEL